MINPAVRTVNRPRAETAILHLSPGVILTAPLDVVQLPLYHCPMSFLSSPGALTLSAVVVVLIVLNLMVLRLVLRRSAQASGGISGGGISGGGISGGELASTLTKIGEELGRVEQLAGDVEQLRSVFLMPRSRGVVGELMLEQLLSDWLPRSAYSLQHSFRDGARVDAVVRLGSYLVAIDAKFPLESLGEIGGDAQKLRTAAAKALRPQIVSIAEKYIRTEEGTLPFALMYLPSEHLYYEVFVAEDGPLWRFALEHGVVPVGPNALLLYLQTVAYGLRGFAFSERGRSLSAALSRLSREVGTLGRELHLAEKHFQNFESSFRGLGESYRRVSSDVEELDAGVMRQPHGSTSQGFGEGVDE